MSLAEKCEESPEEQEDRKDYELLLIAARQQSLLLQQMCSIPQGELTMLLVISNIEEEKDRSYVLPSEIKNVMRLSRPAVSRMLHNLESKGYLVRKISDSDHRYVRVEITGLGREKMAAALKRCTEILKRVKGKMGQEDMGRFLEYNRKFCMILSEEIMA